MKPSVLLITHAGIGAALRETAEEILGQRPMPIAALAPEPDEPVASMQGRVEAAFASLDHGEGVLMLTDAYGATPSNMAVALGGHYGYPVIAGLNLPMLLRVMNYPHLPVEQLIDKALSAARDGILVADRPSDPVGQRHG